MKSGIRGAFCLFALCALLALNLSADTIIATYNGQTPAVTVSYNTSYGNGSTSAGYFRFIRNGGTFTQDPRPIPDLNVGDSEVFLGFCLELGEFIGGSYGNTHEWEVVELKDGRTPPPAPAKVGDLGASRISALFSQAYPSGLLVYPSLAVEPNRNLIGQALQIAIWEILYETDALLGLNTGTAKFRTDGDYNTIALGAEKMANDWLLAINNGYNRRAQGLFAMNKDGIQDFVIQTGGSPDIELPEPATLGLLGLGLLGIGILRRRLA